MPNYNYFAIALAAGIVGLGVYAASPLIVIGEATQACVYANTFVCGAICSLFAIAGVVSC